MSAALPSLDICFALLQADVCLLMVPADGNFVASIQKGDLKVHIRQSRPESGLGFQIHVSFDVQVHVFNTFETVVSSLGSGTAVPRSQENAFP